MLFVVSDEGFDRRGPDTGFLPGLDQNSNKRRAAVAVGPLLTGFGNEIGKLRDLQLLRVS